MKQGSHIEIKRSCEESQSVRDFTACPKNSKTLIGHSGAIRSLAVLPDGTLASGSNDNTIKLWDSKTGQCSQTLSSGYGAGVTTLAVLSDGTLASASAGFISQKGAKDEDVIKLWDSGTGKCIQTFVGHKEGVCVLVALSDGTLASGSIDKTIKIWDPKTGKCLQTLSGHSTSIWGLTETPDGILASGSYGKLDIDNDSAIKLWDPKAWFGKCLKSIKVYRVTTLAVLSDGRLASGSDSGSNGSLQLLLDPNTPPRQRIYCENPGRVNALVVLPNGTLVSGSQKDLKLWNTETGQCPQTMDTDGVTFALALLPDGTLVSGGTNKNIRYWTFPEKFSTLSNDITLQKSLEQKPVTSQLTLMERCFDTENETKIIDKTEEVKTDIKSQGQNVVLPVILQMAEKQPHVDTERVWHFDAKSKEMAKIDRNESYKLMPASPRDMEKVKQFYSHHPVPGMVIAEDGVQVIYNPIMNRSFALRMALLQERENNSAFEAKWVEENQTPEQKGQRDEINKLARNLAHPYKDRDYPAVKILPLWHGTKSSVLESLLKTGYANLATTDSGFFGKGIYSAYEAEYAYNVYYQGKLVINFVAFFSAYPVIKGDMGKLEGKGNYQNYDAHFVPVVPANPNNPNEKVYFPCAPNQKYRYIEVVVFESAQCLPRYVVDLKLGLLKSPSNLLPQQKKEKEENQNQPLLSYPNSFFAVAKSQEMTSTKNTSDYPEYFIKNN